MTRRSGPASQCGRAALAVSALLQACGPAEPVEVEAGPPSACDITYDAFHSDEPGVATGRAVGGFDAAANLVRLTITNRFGGSSTMAFTYDAAGHQTSFSYLNADGDVAQRSTSAYDAQGHRISERVDDGGDGTAEFSSTDRYVDGRPTRSEDDPDGDGPAEPRVVETRTYDAAGVETGLRAFRYGQRGVAPDPEEIRYVSASRCTAAEGKCGPGEPRVVTRAGDVQYPETDSRSEYRYRPDGKVEFESHDLDGDGAAEQTTRYTYDADGLLTGYERAGDVQGAERETCTVETRDADGRPLRTRVSRGDVTLIRTQTYNERGDEVESAESTEQGAWSRQTTREYDPAGHLTRTVETWHSDTSGRIESLWTYDAAGRQATHEVRGSTGDEYTARATEWQADGLAVAWNVDRDADGETDQTVAVTRDAHAAEVATRTRSRGDIGPDLEWRETLDGADRVLESIHRTLPQGALLSAKATTFDEAGRPLETRIEGTAGWVVTDVHAYDDRGRMILLRQTSVSAELTSETSLVATTACLPTTP